MLMRTIVNNFLASWRILRRSPTGVRPLSVQQHVRDLAISAKQASQLVANSPVSVRNAALEAIAGTIQSQRQSLLDANTIDLSAARDARLDAALIDRLELTETRVDDMLESLAIVQALSDPIGGIG